MQLELLIGASPFALSEEDAWWLTHRIRETCVDVSRRPLDTDAMACLQLADVLADDLERGDSPEPIELGHSHARGLTEHVLGLGAAQEHELEAFYAALLRFRGNSV